MSIPTSNINIKYIIDYTLKTVLDQPDRWIPQIFGDFKLSPNESLYGNRMIDAAKRWTQTTKVTTLLGMDMSQVELPCITIHQISSSPSQSFMGDYGFQEEYTINNYEREVIVPKFQLKSLTYDYTSDRSYIELKDDMPQNQSELVMAGFYLRDNNGENFIIGFDDLSQKLYLSKLNTPLSQIEDTAVEIVSPLDTRRYSGGAMQFQETIAISCHGHQNKTETEIMHAVVMWGLLKFRPLMVELFNMDLSFPSSQDLQIDSTYLGNAVFVKQIQLTCKTMWTWEGPQLQDIIGILLSTKPGRVEF